jgi:predicted Zn-dependent peptidase
MKYKEDTVKRYKSLLIIFPLIIILLAGSSVTAGQDFLKKIKFPPLNDIVLPEIEQITLDNGLIVYLLEDHKLPIINASARLAAGGYLEPVEKIGLTDIVGTVMRTGGTADMTGDEIDELLESMGATIETSMGNTSGNAYMNILSEQVDKGLEVLSGILRTPQFDQEKIDIAKSSARTAISSRNDNPFNICIREFRKIIYGSESPLARHTEYATIDNINREDLFDFHKKYVSPNNTMIALWGDFDKSEMIEKIRKYFGDWQPIEGKNPLLPEVTYEFKKGVHYIEKENLTQSSVLLGHIGGLMGDPDYFALTVANLVLGGDGNGGRMFNEIRSRKGLAYSTTGQFTSNISYPGIFYNYVITKLESTGEAIDAVANEVRRMQTDPPTPEELKIAKDTYLNSFVFNFDTKAEIINRMMAYDYYGFPRDFLQTAKSKIDQVTAEDVIDVAKRRFHPDSMHLVVVGIAEKFDRPLEEYGNVNNIDITIPTSEKKDELEINEETLARGMELLKKAVASCGGEDKFKTIKAVSAKAEITLSLPQGEFAMGIESFEVFPDKSKEVMNTPMGEIVSCINGDTGWMQQGGQVMDLPPDQLKSAEEDKFRNTIALFGKIGQPDFQSVFVEIADFNGIQAEIIKIIAKDGEHSFKMALDSNTGMPLGIMYFGETMGGPGNIVKYYSDYRDLNGMKIPYASYTESNGNKIAELKITSIEINPEIPEGSFKKPE